MTGLFAHGVWLSLVLGHSGVDSPALQLATADPPFLHFFILDNVGADWRLEDAWKRVRRIAGRAIGGDDRYYWSGGHVGGRRGLSMVVNSKFCAIPLELHKTSEWFCQAKSSFSAPVLADHDDLPSSTTLLLMYCIIDLTLS